LQGLVKQGLGFFVVSSVGCGNGTHGNDSQLSDKQQKQFGVAISGFLDSEAEQLAAAANGYQDACGGFGCSISWDC
jgi:hypothetical protein